MLRAVCLFRAVRPRRKHGMGLASAADPNAARPLKRLAGALAVILIGSFLCAPAASATSLTLGFFDWRPLTGVDSTMWLPKAQQVGAQIIRLTTNWKDVAPLARPDSFDGSDPADPAYRWTTLDAQVTTLRSAGFDVLLTVQGAPAWAEGPDRPSTREIPAGAWDPDPQALAAFFTALAQRYSGTYPGPSGVLPRVTHFQVWNEPNLWLYLAPQWTKSGNAYSATSPSVYRSLLNASYAAIKRVQPDATVLSAGTAPYGDPSPGGRRMPPVTFVRSLLCFKGTALTKQRCADPAHLDAYDHHSYGVRGPHSSAANADDVSTPDVGKLTRMMRKAVTDGTVLPRGTKPMWMTEIAYDSNPPDPDGVPIAQQATWLEQSLQVLDREGVHHVLWFSVADAAPIPSYAATYQAGLFFLDGQPKPAATAFRFPFVRDGGRVWGRAPVSGRLVIERRAGTSWRAVKTMPIRATQAFNIRIDVPRNTTLRARVGAETSLTWPVAAS
jgi:hypothetical protein